MKFKTLQMKRQFVSGKTVVGIDPAKRSHYCCMVDCDGQPVGKGFSISNTHEGFRHFLWKKLAQRVEEINPKTVVFAIETACNLWVNLAHYLCSSGYPVVLVSPLSTHRSRPLISHNFSKSDPKDAFLVASNAQNGFFDFYHQYSEAVKAMHYLSLSYDKLRKDYVRQRNRLRAFLDRIFPEFPLIVPLKTKSARYLLSKYFLPQHFLTLDVQVEAKALEKVSLEQHGEETLRHLQQAARHSIGIPLSGPEILAAQLTLNSWLALLDALDCQMQEIISEVSRLAQKTPYYKTLTSLPGISDKLASLFIAVTRDLGGYQHFKQIEKLAGYNLRVSDSGQAKGARHISHIGNRRLSWLLYKMTEETAKYVSEVRLKFLRRQLQARNYRKNIVASAPSLLKLIMALVKENRTYEIRPENQAELNELEIQYAELKSKGRKKPKSSRLAA